MIILWDEPKRLSNLQKHGLDFAELDESFLERSNIVSARAGRLMAIGQFGVEPITVIFRWVGSEAVAIISMRKSSRKERNP